MGHGLQPGTRAPPTMDDGEVPRYALASMPPHGSMRTPGPATYRDGGPGSGSASGATAGHGGYEGLHNYSQGRGGRDGGRSRSPSRSRSRGRERGVAGGGEWLGRGTEGRGIRKDGDARAGSGGRLRGSRSPSPPRGRPLGPGGPGYGPGPEPRRQPFGPGRGSRPPSPGRYHHHGPQSAFPEAEAGRYTQAQQGHGPAPPQPLLPMDGHMHGTSPFDARFGGGMPPPGYHGGNAFKEGPPPGDRFDDRNRDYRDRDYDRARDRDWAGHGSGLGHAPPVGNRRAEAGGRPWERDGGHGGTLEGPARGHSREREQYSQGGDGPSHDGRGGGPADRNDRGDDRGRGRPNEGRERDWHRDTGGGADRQRPELTPVGGHAPGFAHGPGFQHGGADGGRGPGPLTTMSPAAGMGPGSGQMALGAVGVGPGLGGAPSVLSRHDIGYHRATVMAAAAGVGAAAAARASQLALERVSAFAEAMAREEAKWLPPGEAEAGVPPQPAAAAATVAALAL
jgi:hypothetical protein